MTSGDTFSWSLLPSQRFAVIHDFSCGRELVATRDFQPGDLILRETPLLIFGDRKELVKLLGRLSSVEKEELFDMQGLSAPTQASHMSCRTLMERLWTEAEVFHQLFYGEISDKLVSVSIDDIFRVLSIAHLNAHSFHPTEQEPDRAAIFPVSAKIAHSCLPNSTYTVTDDGLEYYAVSFIKRGAPITASYLDSDALVSSVEKRRNLLARSKDFFCLCVKCRRASDLASGLKCRSHRCSGTSYFCNNSTTIGGIASWRCSTCGSRTEPVVKTLHSIEREYNALQDCDDVDEFIDKLSCLIEASRPDLSRAHYLLTEMQLELSTVHLAVAHAWVDRADAEAQVAEHRRTAIDILEDVTARIECVDDDSDACGCRQSTRCEKSHPPSLTAAFLVYRALCSVLRMKAAVPGWISRYRSLLVILYGIENGNVAALTG